MKKESNHQPINATRPKAPPSPPKLNDPAKHATEKDKHLAFEWLREIATGNTDNRESAAILMYELIKSNKAFMIGNAKIRGVNQYSFRVGEWAEIIGVKVCKPHGQKKRAVYECLYCDGIIDYIALSDSENYEISTE